MRELSGDIKRGILQAYLQAVLVQCSASRRIMEAQSGCNCLRGNIISHRMLRWALSDKMTLAGSHPPPE